MTADIIPLRNRGRGSRNPLGTYYGIRPGFAAPGRPPSCEYPVSKPSEPFRACGEKRQPGSVYCAEHHERCHRKPGEHR